VTDQLVLARLLVVQTGAGATGATVELVHESLIHGWPTLRRWLDESQEDSAFLEQLRNATRQWQSKGKDSGLLWRGEMVEEARRFQRRYRGELPQAQQDFLEALFAQAAKVSRWRRTLAVGSIVFLALLVAASAVALVLIHRSNQEARHQTVAARKAEAEARAAAQAELKAKEETKEHLKQVQAEMEQRLNAEKKEREIKQQLLEALADQERLNKELKLALTRARYARRMAVLAQQRADQNAEAARQAEENAVKEAREKERLLKAAQERARRLQEKLGAQGPVPSLYLAEEKK
jgi:hypothetical protein